METKEGDLEVVETKEGDLEVVIRHPVASIGLYHHYNVKASICSVCDKTQN